MYAVLRATTRQQVLFRHVAVLNEARWFASNKKKKNKDTGKGISLKLCTNPYDVDETAEFHNTVKFKNKPTTVKEIQEKLSEEMGMNSKSIEYYDKGDWKKLTNPAQQLKGQNKSIRIPELYDETEYDDYDDEDEYSDDDFNLDEDDEGMDDYYPEDVDSMFDSDVAATIREFVMVLKSQGYSPCYGEKLQKGDIVHETKDWVLEQVQDDLELQNLLLSKIGALDHIVQCLHYDFVWKDDADTEDPVEVGAEELDSEAAGSEEVKAEEAEKNK